VALILIQAAPGLTKEPAARTTRDRIFTAQQAERGKEIYKKSCAPCHALDFYSGHTMKSWEGGSLSDLYAAISTLMPQGNPGSLKRREYLDILAYILSLNDMPAGDEDLPTGAADLKPIRIKWRTKP
jgi:mono/diheme cytochrome c family protein